MLWNVDVWEFEWFDGGNFRKTGTDASPFRLATDDKMVMIPRFPRRRCAGSVW